MATELIGGNTVTLLESGYEYFPALVAAIDAAQYEIHLETYIYKDDLTGRNITAALIRAAERGVAVHVLVDGFGAPDFASTVGVELRQKGAQVLVYRQEVPKVRLSRTRLRRLHRKIVVVDGAVAFVGGINILDDYNDDGAGVIDSPRLDYAVRVAGPLAPRIHAEARHVWRLVRWSFIGRRPQPLPPMLAIPGDQGAMRAALLIRDNLRHRRDIENAYVEAINAARREVLIANAYFLPGTRVLRALRAAAKRGVNVTLLLQGRVEHALQYFATQSLYADLVSSGIRIFVYRKSYLHAKVAVIDEDWATVGSSNIDPFSLLLAREANVLVRDSYFAEQLRASVLKAMATGAEEMSPDELSHRPLWLRATEWGAYIAVRLLLTLTGLGRQYER